MTSTDPEYPGGQWPCPDCTFLNQSMDLTCTMCYRVRTSTKDCPIVWQWLAAEQWIPFDSLSNNEIEAAYQSGRTTVRLTQGWFKSQSSHYQVRFDRARKHHNQFNLDSGNRRHVRRVANDENDLFVECDEQERKTLDKCSICQREFDGDNDGTDTDTDGDGDSKSDSDRVVRLLNCNTGHGFHHNCIASWIKLKDHCPYCSTRI